MLANWLALIALLALGVVWPPPNTAGAVARLHTVVTARCAGGSAARGVREGIAR